MNRQIRRQHLLAVAALCVLVATARWLGASPASASEDTDGLAQRMTPDLVRSVSRPEMQGVVYCYPPEFWEVTLAATGQESDPEALQILRSYVVVGVIEVSSDPTGQQVFRTRAQLQRDLKIIDGQSHDHRPLPPDSMDAAAEEIVRRMQSETGRLGGDVGIHVQFFVFRAMAADGKPIVDPRQPGSFAIETGAARYEWQLPLASLMPPKVCPVDGGIMTGPWKYCPHHGVELKDATPEAHKRPDPTAGSEATSRAVKDRNAI